MRIWLAGALVFPGMLATGCASAPKPDPAAALAEADRLLAEGCYDCLTEARDLYARIAVGALRPMALAYQFEAELLLALREKELALDPSPSVDRAREIARQLPAAFGADRLLGLVDVVVPDEVGLPVREMREFRLLRAGAAARVNDDLIWLATSALRMPARQYVALALDCSYLQRTPRPGQPRRPRGEKPAVPADAPPLVQYRVGICLETTADTMRAVRTAVPRFVEAAYFLSRVELLRVQQTGGATARELLAEALGRFPGSPAITYTFGTFNRLVGDCKEALRHYDATIGLKAEHEDAMLGRTVCLSHLRRHGEAIASATQMIGLLAYNMADAYYWRAWNHHVLKDLPSARRDIERAKAMGSNGQVLTLAGVIEHDQDDLDAAEADLTMARRMAYGNRNCTAAWYLALVHMKRDRWAESSRVFEQAMSCYEENVRENERSLTAMQTAPDVDPAFRASQIAGFEAAITEDRGQYHAAAFNTANQAARAGDVPRAKTFLEVAAKDPALDELVRQLREILKGGA